MKITIFLVFTSLFFLNTLHGCFLKEFNEMIVFQQSENQSLDLKFLQALFVEKNKEKARRHLLAGANINTQYLIKNVEATPLIHAIQRGNEDNYETAKWLIKNKAKVNQSSYFTLKTPLMAAAACCYNNDKKQNKESLLFIKLLIDKGADTKARSIFNQTAQDCVPRAPKETKIISKVLDLL